MILFVRFIVNGFTRLPLAARYISSIARYLLIVLKTSVSALPWLVEILRIRSGSPATGAPAVPARPFSPSGVFIHPVAVFAAGIVAGVVMGGLYADRKRPSSGAPAAQVL